MFKGILRSVLFLALVGIYENINAISRNIPNPNDIRIAKDNTNITSDRLKELRGSLLQGKENIDEAIQAAVAGMQSTNRKIIKSALDLFIILVGYGKGIAAAKRALEYLNRMDKKLPSDVRTKVLGLTKILMKYIPYRI